MEKWEDSFTRPQAMMRRASPPGQAPGRKGVGWSVGSPGDPSARRHRRTEVIDLEKVAMVTLGVVGLFWCKW